MIQVNLLPPEYRSKDRAPVSRLLALVAGVLITFSSLGLYVYFRVILVDNMRVKKQDRVDTHKIRQGRAKEYETLKKQVEAREAREKKIDEIGKSDPRYAPMLDRISQMVWAAEEDPAAPFTAWFSSLGVKLVRATGRSRAKGEVPEFKFVVSTATDDAANVSSFYRKFKRDDYMALHFEMANINPPKTDLVEYPQYDPDAAMNFEVTVQSFPNDERVKRVEEAAKRAAEAEAEKSGDGKGKSGKGKGKSGKSGKKG